MRMAKKRTFTKPFPAALEYFLRATRTTQKEIAHIGGYENRNMITAILDERTDGREDKRRKIAEYFLTSYDDFLDVGFQILDGVLNPIEAPTPPSDRHQLPTRRDDDVISFEEEILKKHVNVLPNFQQKELALEINQMLVELEEINPAELLAVKKYVKFQLMEAKESAGTASKKTGTTDQPT